MDRNERKAQILEIFLDAKGDFPRGELDLEQLAERAGIEKHHALVMCTRYHTQGLLSKTGSSPSRFVLSRRGRARLHFLTQK